MTKLLKKLRLSSQMAFGRPIPPVGPEHEEIYRTYCVHYLRRQGWKVATPISIEEHSCSHRGKFLLVFFWDNERSLSEIQIRDWGETRDKRKLPPVFVFAQVEPPEWAVKSAALRGLTLRNYKEIGLLDFGSDPMRFWAEQTMISRPEQMT